MPCRQSLSLLVAPGRILLFDCWWIIHCINYNKIWFTCQAFLHKKGIFFHLFSKFFWLFFKVVLYFFVRKECWKWQKKGFAEVSFFQNHFMKKRKSKLTRNLDRSPAWWLSPWKNIWKKKRRGENSIRRRLLLLYIYCSILYIYKQVYIISRC